MKQYIPAEKLVRGALVAFSVQSVIALALAANIFWQSQLAGRMLSGQDVPPVEITRCLRYYLMLGWAEGIAAVAAGCYFFPFLGRANHNARVLGAEDLPASPLWAMLCYLVPVLNMWVPHVTLQEAWMASDPRPGDWKRNPGSGLILTWWIQRVLSCGWGRVGVMMMYWYPLQTILTPSANTDSWFRYLYPLTTAIVPNTQLACRLMIGAIFFQILQFVLTGMVMQQLERRLRARHQLMGVPHDRVDAPVVAEWESLLSSR